MSFGERFRKIRNRDGISVADIIEKLGVHQSTVSFWERGERIPKVDTIIEFCRIYKIDPNELFFDDWEAKSQERNLAKIEADTTFDFTSKLLNERLQQITDEIAELREKVEGK